MTLALLRPLQNGGIGHAIHHGHQQQQQQPQQQHPNKQPSSYFSVTTTTTTTTTTRARPQKWRWVHLGWWCVLFVVMTGNVVVVAWASKETEVPSAPENYRWFCELVGSPEVTLEWDAKRQSYVVPNHPNDYDGYNNNNNNNKVNTPASSGWGRRLLQQMVTDYYYNYANYRGGVDLQQQQQQQHRTATKYLRSSVDPPFLFYDGQVEPAVWSSHATTTEETSISTIIPTSNVYHTNGRHRWLRNLNQTEQQQQQQTGEEDEDQSEPEPQLPTNSIYNNSLGGGGYFTFGDEGTQTAAPQPPPTIFTTTNVRVPMTVKVRACDCWNSMVWGGAFYCPLPRTHCAIPSSPAGLPGCLDVQKQRRVVRSIWPVLVVWYASVLFCLSFTITGRHAMSCCIATVYPAWNRQTANRLLRHDPDHANQLLVRHYRIMRMRYERRLLQRLRRRARRQRRRQQQQQNNTATNTTNNDTTNHNHNHNNNNRTQQQSDDSDDDEIEPFPSLWDFAIFPQQQMLQSAVEPCPKTLTLKTKLYKRDDHQDQDNITNKPNDTTNDDREINGESSEMKNADTATACIKNDKDSDHPVFGTLLATDNPINPTSAHQPDDGNDATPCNDNNNNNHDNDHSSNQNLEWDEHACTICYVPLEDGDRVGALSCGHVFHVDPCLKHWLARRNVCPLCLTENVAEPQFDANRRPCPIVVAASRTTARGNDDNASSGSDPDRSSSRDDDGDGDDDSSGVLNDPNIIPAFSIPRRNHRPRRRAHRQQRQQQQEPQQQQQPQPTAAPSRMIELTSLFRRQRNNNQTPTDNTTADAARDTRAAMEPNSTAAADP